MKVCHRCKQETDELFLSPYVYECYPKICICRKCSELFHKLFDEFSENFLNHKTKILPDALEK